MNVEEYECLIMYVVKKWKSENKITRPSQMKESRRTCNEYSIFLDPRAPPSYVGSRPPVLILFQALKRKKNMILPDALSPMAFFLALIFSQYHSVALFPCACKVVV